MKSSTYTLSHAHRNNLKNDNRSSEHFRQIFASQNTRNGVSEHENFKIFWKSKLPDQAKLRSIDSCQKGTSAVHYQKTNNVGSGSLRYTIWHFPLHAGWLCLAHTRSLSIGIFAILMKVN